MNRPRLSTVRSLRDLPGGIEPSVVEKWLEGFREVPGNESQNDFNLTDLQVGVANSDEAFAPGGPNLLICGPPAAGKTFAAEMLIAQRLKAGTVPRGTVYLVPLRVLATEKWERFQQVFGDGVWPSSSDYQQFDKYILNRNFRIAVVVYEKFLKWLLDDRAQRSILQRTGLLIVDEMQMLADVQRGGKLELLLTLVRDYQLKGGNIRIIGLGPSLRALSSVSKWLNCNEELSLPDDAQRTIPLVEGYLTRSGASEFKRPLDSRLATFRGSEYSFPSPGGANLKEFVEEVVRQLVSPGSGVGSGPRLLIYCAGKDYAESTATNLSRVLGQRQTLSQSTLQGFAELENTTSLELLRQTVSSGVAFHHGDLTLGERKLVERLFRELDPGEDKLDIVVCTPTLGMGVNLPADYMLFTTENTYRPTEVIIQDPGGTPLTPLEYRNFAGRAGRNRPNPPDGLHGVALFLTEKDKERAHREILKEIIEAPVEPLDSALHRGPYGLEPLVLGTLAWQRVYSYGRTTPASFKETIEGTFAAYMNTRVGRVRETPRTIDNDPPNLTDISVAEAARESLLQLCVDRKDLVREREEPDGETRYVLQDVGRVVAQMGIHVKTYLIIRKISSELPGILDSPLKLLERLVQAPEVANLYPRAQLPATGDPRTKVVRPLKRFLRDMRSENSPGLESAGEETTDVADTDSASVSADSLGEIANEFLAHQEYSADDLEYMIRIAAVWHWMNGATMREMEQTGMFPGMRYGSIATLADQLSWFIDSLIKIWAGPDDAVELGDAEELELRERTKWELTCLQRRLRYGVPPGLESVAHLNVHGWHRGLLKALSEALGPMDHCVRLLDRGPADIPKGEDHDRLVDMLKSLQDRIRVHEFSDDPRSTAERQLVLIAQATEERPNQVDDTWSTIIPELHEASITDLTALVRQAMSTKPLEWQVSSTTGGGEVRTVLTIRENTRIGIEVVEPDSDGILTVDDLVKVYARTLDGKRVQRLVIVSSGDVGDVDSFVQQCNEPSLLVLTREAFAQVCARAVLGERVDDPQTKKREPSLRAESVLSTSRGALRTRLEVEEEFSSSVRVAYVESDYVNRGATSKAALKTFKGLQWADGTTISLDEAWRAQLFAIKGRYDRYKDGLSASDRELIDRVIQEVETAPVSSLTLAHQWLEGLVEDVHEARLGPPKKPNDIPNAIRSLRESAAVDQDVAQRALSTWNLRTAHAARDQGGSRRPRPTNSEEATLNLSTMERVVEWVAQETASGRLQRN